jgi:hypothetical protein
MTCDPPFALLLNPEECDLDFEGCGEVGTDHVAKPNADESKGEIYVTDTSTAANEAPEAQNEEDSDQNSTVNQRNDRANVIAPTSSMVLMSAGRAQSQQSQAEGQSVTFHSTHFFSSMPFTSSSKLSKQEEMAESYLNEKDNWVKSCAFSLVKTSDIPPGRTSYRHMLSTNGSRRMP